MCVCLRLDYTPYVPLNVCVMCVLCVTVFVCETGAGVSSLCHAISTCENGEIIEFAKTMLVMA